MLTEPIGTVTPKEPTHVDNFIDYGSNLMSVKWPENEDYARWVLNHFRLNSILRSVCDKFMADHKLFCDYQGKKYRVIGASRMGDVWLTSKFKNDTGYEHRVCVDELSNWQKS